MFSNARDLSSASQQTPGLHLVALIDRPADLAQHPRIRGALSPRAVRRVREYIEAHLEESISIDALARIAGLSMYHFSRAFKQSEGVTPHHYLLQCRVRRAKELLTGTDLPLSEIALASGFSDQSHCARRFREHVGITPSSYRWSMQ
jgi:transcriptional regulator GlxA family with amidase domain